MAPQQQERGRTLWGSLLAVPLVSEPTVGPIKGACFHHACKTMHAPCIPQGQGDPRLGEVFQARTRGGLPTTLLLGPRGASAPDLSLQKGLGDRGRVPGAHRQWKEASVHLHRSR